MIAAPNQGVKREVFPDIEMFYNPKRGHTFRARISPVAFEKRYFENQKNGQKLSLYHNDLIEGVLCDIY